MEIIFGRKLFTNERIQYISNYILTKKNWRVSKTNNNNNFHLRREKIPMHILNGIFYIFNQFQYTNAYLYPSSHLLFTHIFLFLGSLSFIHHFLMILCFSQKNFTSMIQQKFPHMHINKRMD